MGDRRVEAAAKAIEVATRAEAAWRFGVNDDRRHLREAIVDALAEAGLLAAPSALDRLAEYARLHGAVLEIDYATYPHRKRTPDGDWLVRCHGVEAYGETLEGAAFDVLAALPPLAADAKTPGERWRRVDVRIIPVTAEEESDA